MGQDKKNIDWDRVEIDYRANILTLREMADNYHVSHVMIAKRAKKDGWVRDLNAKIHARAKELVNKAVVNSEVTKERLVTEKATIEANATAIADVIKSHVTGINKLQKVCDDLTSELVEQSVSKEDLLKVAELFAIAQSQDGEKPDEKDIQHKMDAFMKSLNLSNRADIFKKLVEAKTRLITLERAAFDIDKGAGKTPSLGEFLESLT